MLLEALTERLLQMSPAYDAAGDFHEGFVDGSEALEANTQSAKVVKPRNGPLHDPACFA
jgi:hypothetical protein